MSNAEMNFRLHKCCGGPAMPFMHWHMNSCPKHGIPKQPKLTNKEKAWGQVIHRTHFDDNENKN